MPFLHLFLVFTIVSLFLSNESGLSLFALVCLIVEIMDHRTTKKVIIKGFNVYRLEVFNGKKKYSKKRETVQ